MLRRLWLLFLSEAWRLPCFLCSLFAACLEEGRVIYTNPQMPGAGAQLASPSALASLRGGCPFISGTAPNHRCAGTTPHSPGAPGPLVFRCLIYSPLSTDRQCCVCCDFDRFIRNRLRVPRIFIPWKDLIGPISRNSVPELRFSTSKQRGKLAGQRLRILWMLPFIGNRRGRRPLARLFLCVPKYLPPEFTSPDDMGREG